MLNTQDLERINGATVYDADGDKVGSVDQVYLDDQSETPTWVTVTTGMFGTSQSFIPLERASLDGNDLRVGYDKATIKGAPRIDADQHLERSEEDELYRYYGLSSSSGQAGDAGQGFVETTGQQHAPTTGDETAMTASEERLEVGKERVHTGTARLRKYTTTETESVEVPVTKEKLSVERTPASGTATPGGLGDTAEQVEEVTLSEERVRVEKETVPVEEVRIGKETVTEHEQVTDEVRKEHVEVEGDVDDRGTSGTR